MTYDAAGNVTSDSRAAGTYVYAYDVAGRLSSSVTLGGVLQASYLYDYQGRQAVRTLGA